jgi:hypothetical protein
MKRVMPCTIVTCMCDYRRGFGLDIGFIDHFNTQLVITLNYTANADIHTLHFTPAHSKSFPFCSVFTRHFLVTASKNGYSSASALNSSLNGGCLACISVAAGNCLLSRCLEAALLRFQGRRINQASIAAACLVRFTLLPWRWRQCIPWIHRYWQAVRHYIIYESTLLYICVKEVLCSILGRNYSNPKIFL